MNADSNNDALSGGRLQKGKEIATDSPSGYSGNGGASDVDGRGPMKGAGLSGGLGGIDASFSAASLSEAMSATGTRAVADKHKIMLAERESRAVQRLKFLVFVFLSTCMSAVAYGVYWYMTTSEIEEFRLQFREDATKVLSTLGTNQERIVEAMDAFAVSIISYARVSNQTWPFVVIPDFAVRAEKIRALSNAVYINTYHLVDVDQRDEWQKFTSMPTSHSWVNESIALQDENPANSWQTIWNYTLWDVIHGYDEWDKEEELQGVEGINTTGPWLPLWQIMPVIPVRAVLLQ